MAGKKVGRLIRKKLHGAMKASPEKIAQYTKRAIENTGKGAAALSMAGEQYAAGDYRGAAKTARKAAVTVVGKNNIKQVGKAALTSKQYQAANKGGRLIKRADKAYGQYESGDKEGMKRTLMGKKAYEELSKGTKMPGDFTLDERMQHHVSRANHHSSQLMALQSALSGRPVPM